VIIVATDTLLYKPLFDLNVKLIGKEIDQEAPLPCFRECQSAA